MAEVKGTPLAEHPGRAGWGFEAGPEARIQRPGFIVMARRREHRMRRLQEAFDPTLAGHGWRRTATRTRSTGAQQSATPNRVPAWVAGRSCQSPGEHRGRGPRPPTCRRGEEKTPPRAIA